MESRQEDLNQLKLYIDETDKEITMILQNLQWDQKHLVEGAPLVSCQYDSNHKIPPDKKESHEKECFLRSQGYTKQDKLLPDILDPEASTAVKLCKEDIRNIINYVSQSDPSFKRGPGSGECEPLSAARLQAAYSADERRALYDAVTCATPLARCSQDFTLPSANQSAAAEELRKSRLQLLAELRDMKRRRVKYRGAGGATGNYSHVLRDHIKTQMEIYTGVQTEEANNSNVAKDRQNYAEQPQKIDNKPYQRHRSTEKPSVETRNYKSEEIPQNRRERSHSVDRKRHSNIEKYKRKDDRYSNYAHRYDEEHRTKRIKYDTRERSLNDSSRDCKDKRRQRERSSESSSHSKNGREFSKDRSHESYVKDRSHKSYKEDSSRRNKKHRDRYSTTSERSNYD